MSAANLKKLGEKLQKIVKKASDADDWDEFWEENGKKIAKDLGLSKGKAKKAKKEKDPDAPKAAVNAYILYCKDRRPGIKEEKPDLKGIEITKAMGAEWKKLSDEKKKKYIDAQKKDKERFEAEMKEYKENGGGASKKEDDDDEEEEKPKKKKAAAKPKKEAAKKSEKGKKEASKKESTKKEADEELPEDDE